MSKESVPFFVPWITEEDKKAVTDAINDPWLTGGPKALEFENAFVNYMKSDYAVSLSSCTAALHLSMITLGIGPGDEVIVPVLTFAATPNAPISCGAKPVFADVDEKTYNISPTDVMERITDKTKAILAVHYGGQSCDMKELGEIAEDYNLHIIEDCAHSLGSYYSGNHTGTFGKVGCFSFYPNKNITTIEGGMATTNDKNIAERMKSLRSHGLSSGAKERKKEATWYYDISEVGYSYRLNDVQAALGISQLKRLEIINGNRIEAAKNYTKKLGALEGIIPPLEAKNRTHVYHIYVIRVIEEEFGLSRDELFKYLSQKEIGLSVHYTPLHFLTLYKNMYGYKIGDFPIAEQLYPEILTLPLFPTITHSQIDYVVSNIQNARRI